MLTRKVIEMESWFWPILRLLAGLIHVLGIGGIRAVLAENLLLKQLLVVRQSRRRRPIFAPPTVCMANSHFVQHRERDIALGRQGWEDVPLPAKLD